MKAPEGLRYVPDFLTRREQGWLLEKLRGIGFEEWHQIRFRGQLARRRKLAYGWNYEPGSRKVTAAPALPEFLIPLRERCAIEAGLPPEKLVQATMTVYPKGAGIGPHRDAPFFGNEVVGVSLGAVARLIFRHGADKYVLEMEPGSWIELSGPARSRWTHEMPPVEDERYSIYFRSLRPVD